MTLSVDIGHRLGAFEIEARFEAPPGVTALFGRSGSGKTSIVNAVAGLLRPQRGRILIGGDVVFDSASGIDIPAWRRRVGYVFQDGRLFPHMNVRQNLLFGQRFAATRMSRGEVDHVIELLGLGDKLARKPAGLSGGEKQRVAIGRALLCMPRLLLMDEPLASLDDERKGEILPYLERLRDDIRVPIVYVSHSLAEVARLATTVVALRAGRTVLSGPAAELLADPSAVPLFGAREAGATLTATIVGHDAGDGLSELAVSGGRLLVPTIAAPPGTPVRLRIEARDVLLAREKPARISALNVLPATVRSIHLGGGPGAAVGLTTGTDRLLARITRRSVRELQLAPGTPCYAILKSTAIAQIDIGRAAGAGNAPGPADQKAKTPST